MKNEIKELIKTYEFEIIALCEMQDGKVYLQPFRDALVDNILLLIKKGLK